MSIEITISEDLCHFIKERASDHDTLKIIMFFADHPYTRFSELAIFHALNQDSGRRYLQKALRDLVDMEIVEMSIDKTVAFYSLLSCKNTLMQSLMLELAKLDMYQRQLLLRQIYPNPLRREGRLSQPRAAHMFSEIPNTAVAERQSSVIFDQKKHLLSEKMLSARHEINQGLVANAVSNL